MLTDRQSLFLERIQRLSLPWAPGNRQEQGCMNQTKAKIQEGWDFKWSINSMNLFLKKLDQDRKLSPEAKKLYDDLVEVYGEPDEKIEQNIPLKRPNHHNHQNLQAGRVAKSHLIILPFIIRG